MDRTVLENRNLCTIDGATEVINFDSNLINFKIEERFCEVGGKNLEIKHFDVENKKLVISGEVEKINYKKEKVSLKKRLFK